MENSKLRIDRLITGAAFAFFLIITCYKLTDAPLWFDETVEYWYSKIMFGELPFNGQNLVDSTNMYQRIVSTFQPPLYNIIMFFWLKISDTEWWFRFFGVVMGFVGMMGIFKSVKRVCNNTVIAAGSVFFSSCIYQLVYYWQECAEYCLMLGSLCWTIYFWICLMQEVSRKNIVLFTVFAIIPVYSQYGAIFPVLMMSLSAYINVLLKKKKKDSIEISIAYISAFVLAALPLYVFFMKEQIKNMESANLSANAIEKGIIGGIFSDLFTVFKTNMMSYYTDEIIHIVLVLILLALGVVLIKGNMLCKWIIGINLFTWVAYDLAVKTGVYSYGSFDTRRYSLFFIPLWVVSGFIIFPELYKIIAENEWLGKRGVQNIYSGVIICSCFCFCFYAWNAKLQGHWKKQDNIKGAVAAWYQENAVEKNTIIYYGADSGFAYYVRKNDAYTEQTENNVVYMYWYRDRSEEEYYEYINSIYGESWPKEIYIVASHYRDDLNTIVKQFTDADYTREDIFNSGGGVLVKLAYSAEAEE